MPVERGVPSAENAVRSLREFGDHPDQTIAQEGLATGEANFFDTQGDEHAHHAEVVCNGQFGILRALCAGAAVDAFVVAAIGDRDAQVCNGAAMLVRQARCGESRANFGMGCDRGHFSTSIGCGKRP